jgi:UDP-hydrolysing UDP-N-acetyl-D-glucosamine 2-epimerase
MKKILAISGIRSDYDLMSALYRRLVADPEIDFRLMVGGAHLSKTFGYSVDLIRADGIPILLEIESLIDADTASARLKSASVMLQNSIDVVAKWKPDLILYAGDREEVWIGALLGIYLGIPTIHFYGGDHTDSWHPDNAIRHAVSKLSALHVVTIEEHRARLRAMGEPDWRIRVLGSLALDNFLASAAPLDSVQIGERDELSEGMGDRALVLFHPDPSESDVAGDICRNILLELKAAGLGAFVGFPNTDPANRDVIAAFAEFKDEPRFFFYRNLERTRFISLYKQSRFIIGNSSSGIMEAASIPIPAINVGLRQRGRYAGRNVIFVDTDRQSLREAIAAALDPVFRKSIAGMPNPYGDGHSCDRAYNLIVNTNFSKLSHKTEDPLDEQGKDGTSQIDKYC